MGLKANTTIGRNIFKNSLKVLKKFPISYGHYLIFITSHCITATNINCDGLHMLKDIELRWISGPSQLLVLEKRTTLSTYCWGLSRFTDHLTYISRKLPTPSHLISTLLNTFLPLQDKDCNRAFWYWWKLSSNFSQPIQMSKWANCALSTLRLLYAIAKKTKWGSNEENSHKGQYPRTEWIGVE